MHVKQLHIIAFDVPYPADYGGVIDVYFRIKALHDLGVSIILHCYEYGRGQHLELEKIALEVHYYKRKRSVIDQFSSIPFIVKSRNSKSLLANLLKDDSPILFEGLHTTYFLSDPRLKNRVKFVRTHNIEHDYYNALAAQSSGLKKRFFINEAKKLKTYEEVLKYADQILCIKPSDQSYFARYGKPCHYLPVSMTAWKEGRYVPTDEYCLFHGNLSVSENEQGATWLIRNVFLPMNQCGKLIVAGKNPGPELIALCEKHGVALRPSPSQEEMIELQAKARVHVLYTENSSGVKLKLVQALATSGHVVTNDCMVEGTDLISFCDVAHDSSAFQALVAQRLTEALALEQYKNRRAYLEAHYDTKKNCARIFGLLADV